MGNPANNLLGPATGTILQSYSNDNISRRRRWLPIEVAAWVRQYAFYQQLFGSAQKPQSEPPVEQRKTQVLVPPSHVRRRRRGKPIPSPVRTLPPDPVTQKTSFVWRQLRDR